MLEELASNFNPGVRHETEERVSRKTRDEEDGTGEKGKVRIDLDAGEVTMVR